MKIIIVTTVLTKCNLKLTYLSVSHQLVQFL